jgi:LuxR family transcriptional regulator, maltose regulon positive regulatory protein
VPDHLAHNETYVTPSEVVTDAAPIYLAVLEELIPAAWHHVELALAHAAAELNQGRTEEAAVQLALAESHLPSAPAARRRRAVAVASLRLALARRSGQFSEVIEQVKMLDSSMADASTEPLEMGSELRGVALLNLGIVETWTGRLLEAERHLSDGAELAQRIGRPYLEVACRAHQGLPSRTVSVMTARERGRQAVALAERHGLDDRPILAPALGAVGGLAIWMGEFDDGERWLRRAWEVASAHVEPATAVLLHLATGMLHAGRGQQRSALKAFTAAARTQSLLIGAHALAPKITGWLATTQARLGMPAEARATLAGFSPEPGRAGAIANAQAWIWLLDGNPGMAVETLRHVRDATPPVDSFTLVEAHLLAGTAHLRSGDRDAAAAAAEAALATAEPDRLVFPFAMTQAAELLDVLRYHETAHRALLADIVDQLRSTTPPSTDREPPPRSDGLTPQRTARLGIPPDKPDAGRNRT